MDRTEKEEVVTSLHKTFEDSSIVVVTHYSGLTVAEMGDLRNQMRPSGSYQTVQIDPRHKMAAARTTCRKEWLLGSKSHTFHRSLLQFPYLNAKVFLVQ